jgi:hypothetical protein
MPKLKYGNSVVIGKRNNKVNFKSVQLRPNAKSKYKIMISEWLNID